MIGSTNLFGYLRVHLTDGCGNCRSRYIHRLVALAFLERLDGKPHVNHKDFNPKNSRADNLEWVTPMENVTYSKLAGRLRGASQPGIMNPRAILSEDDVREIRRLISSGTAGAQIAKQFKMSRETIYHIKHRRQWANVV